MKFNANGELVNTCSIESLIVSLANCLIEANSGDQVTTCGAKFLVPIEESVNSDYIKLLGKYEGTEMHVYVKDSVKRNRNYVAQECALEAILKQQAVNLQFSLVAQKAEMKCIAEVKAQTQFRLLRSLD